MFFVWSITSSPCLCFPTIFALCASLILSSSTKAAHITTGCPTHFGLDSRFIAYTQRIYYKVSIRINVWNCNATACIICSTFKKVLFGRVQTVAYLVLLQLIQFILSSKTLWFLSGVVFAKEQSSCDCLQWNSFGQDQDTVVKFNLFYVWGQALGDRELKSREYTQWEKS